MMGNKAKMPIFTTCNQQVLEVLACTVRQRKGIKSMPVRKEEIKLFLFAGDTMADIENAKKLERKMNKCISTTNK